MKKRSLIFGIAILVGMALIFNGCEQEADDDGGGGAFTDLTADNLYLKTDSSRIDGYSNSLTIDSVIRDNSTGVVTITLSGTIVDVRAAPTTGATGATGVTGTSSDTFWEASYPYDGTFTPAAGKYAAFVFYGAFPADAASRILAVKSKSDAFRYYSAATVNATEELEYPVTQNPGSIYIPTSGVASRWRLYNAGDIPDSDWLSVLLWSEANPKRIDLEIQEFDVKSDYTVLKKIVIDYSKVVFTNADDLAAALGGSGKATASGTTVTVTGTAASVPSGTPVTVANDITLSVPSGATLTVAGTLNVVGTLEVEGTLAVTGTVDATAGTLTVSGGTITPTGDGKVIEDVSEGFPLATGTSTGVSDPHGTSDNLDAAVLKTSTAGGFTTVEVTLTPKASATLSWFDKNLTTGQHGYGLWGPSDSSAPTDWKWTDFSFDVDSQLITLSTSKVVSFKVESFSYYYYAGNAGNATAAPTYPKAADLGSIYIPATYNINTIPVRWKGYNKSHFSSSNKDLTLLLTSGGSKILTLKIYSHDSNDAAAAESAQDTGTHVSTLIIDYTALTPP